jgi:hypothetical protein
MIITPFLLLPIADCRLPIYLTQRDFQNWQSAIANWQSHSSGKRKQNCKASIRERRRPTMGFNDFCRQRELDLIAACE